MAGKNAAGWGAAMVSGFLPEDSVHVPKSARGGICLDGAADCVLQGLLLLVYYAGYFSVRADDFDVVAMAHGKDAVKARMQQINDQGNEASAKDKSLLTILELANEMLERGYNFEMVDLNRSDATDWLIDGDSLIAPFRAIPGLGSTLPSRSLPLEHNGHSFPKRIFLSGERSRRR